MSIVKKLNYRLECPCGSTYVYNSQEPTQHYYTKKCRDFRIDNGIYTTEEPPFGVNVRSLKLLNLFSLGQKLVEKYYRIGISAKGDEIKYEVLWTLEQEREQEIENKKKNIISNSYLDIIILNLKEVGFTKKEWEELYN
tara:strand:+ start:258 stop:674 length:417 start_codon:yes stop_codon:yes gene_type:complete